MKRDEQLETQAETQRTANGKLLLEIETKMKAVQNEKKRMLRDCD